MLQPSIENLPGGPLSHIIHIMLLTTSAGSSRMRFWSEFARSLLWLAATGLERAPVAAADARLRRWLHGI
eukprot:2562957-Prymnesium_polylepis.2